MKALHILGILRSGPVLLFVALLLSLSPQAAFSKKASKGKASRDALPCTTIIVGKAATADGSVLLGHNEDLGDNAAHRYVFVNAEDHSPGDTLTLYSGVTIPQVAHTYAYSATSIFDVAYIPGDITSGINEHQVSIANNLAFQRESTGEAIDGRIIWTEFSSLVLQRAASAREAVMLMGQLAQTYKLGYSTGSIYGITDPDEGWWMEIAPEGQWVAVRVDDDEASFRVNTWRIGTVNLNDSPSVLYSADLVSFATEKGWHNPSDGPFSFALAYSDPVAADAEWNTHREERLAALLTLTPSGITPSDVAALLRDHYEGTPWDLTEGYTNGSPHQTLERPICVDSTEIASVCQSRKELPAAIGAVCWRALTTPCTSGFVPWYFATATIPTAYTLGTEIPSDNAAYWAFRTLSSVVDRTYGAAIPSVQKAWTSFEAAQNQEQRALEDQAKALWATDAQQAKDLLANFTAKQANAALALAQTLREEWDSDSSTADGGTGEDLADVEEAKGCLCTSAGKARSTQSIFVSVLF